MLGTNVSITDLSRRNRERGVPSVGIFLNNKVTTRRFKLCYLLTNILNVLTPWRRVLLEKLTGSQLVYKFPTFYGTRRFFTAFTVVRHLSLS